MYGEKCRTIKNASLEDEGSRDDYDLGECMNILEENLRMKIYMTEQEWPSW